MRTFLFFNIFLFSVTAFAEADCLRVENNQVEVVETEFGITTVEWTAQIENDCEHPYDGTLTVEFRNKSGDIVHETMEVDIIESQGSETTNRSINIPESRYLEVDQVDVAVRERERPI